MPRDTSPERDLSVRRGPCQPITDHRDAQLSYAWRGFSTRRLRAPPDGVTPRWAGRRTSRRRRCLALSLTTEAMSRSLVGRAMRRSWKFAPPTRGWFATVDRDGPNLRTGRGESRNPIREVAQESRHRPTLRNRAALRHPTATYPTATSASLRPQPVRAATARRCGCSPRQLGQSLEVRLDPIRQLVVLPVIASV
jgi:hypothetical protein